MWEVIEGFCKSKSERIQAAPTLAFENLKTLASNLLIFKMSEMNKLLTQKHAA